jgi:hypothetical protein
VAVGEEVDARRLVIQGDAAWELAAGAEKILVAAGRKIAELAPAQAGRDAVLAQITGRTGNLRAPALRRGRVLFIGYNEALYGLVTS